MLHIRIDTESHIPVYRQIVNAIRIFVATGVLKREDQLPSMRDLAKQLSINIGTITKAYNELEREHLIKLWHGRGAFIDALPSIPADQAEKAVRHQAKRLAILANVAGVNQTNLTAMVTEEADLAEKAIKMSQKAG